MRAIRRIACVVGATLLLGVCGNREKSETDTDPGPASRGETSSTDGETGKPSV